MNYDGCLFVKKNGVWQFLATNDNVITKFLPSNHINRVIPLGMDPWAFIHHCLNQGSSGLP